MLGSFGDLRKGERVAGHDASHHRMREVAVEKRPAIRCGGYRNEIDAIEVEEVRQRGAAALVVSRAQRHVPGYQKPVELEIHREGVAAGGKPVARPNLNVAVGLDLEGVVVEGDMICGQTNDRICLRRGASDRERERRQDRAERDTSHDVPRMSFGDLRACERFWATLTVSYRRIPSLLASIRQGRERCNRVTGHLRGLGICRI